MIVKTLDKSRIVFTLTTQELEDRSIHLSTFRYGTKEANDLFKSILQIAEKDFHFEAGIQQLLIEAVPLPKNELMIIICKSTAFPVLNPNHSVFADNRYDQKDTEVSYVFNELDDVLALANSYSTILGRSSLYRFNNKYYVVIFYDNMDYKERLYLNDMACEYGNPTQAYIRSKFLERNGETLIKYDALNKMADIRE